MTVHHLPARPSFPLLDTLRSTDYGRCVIDQLGHVEPYTADTDGFLSMPVRLAHDTASGLHLEIGPYDLDRSAIDVLRQAIAAYDRAEGI